jgi:hypothetical protein
VKIPRGRRSRRWLDNIKMDLKKMGCEDVAQGSVQWRALGYKAMNIRVP